MKRLIIPFLALSAGAVTAATYTLPPETAQLKPSPHPGYEAALGNCLTCHSVDYIAMQPPNRGKTFWEAETVKMIKTYKARITEEDAKLIAEYLTENY